MSIKPYLYIIALFILIGIFSSCVSISSPTIQPQINNLVVAERYGYASKILKDNRSAYGKQDELLYLLDAGMVAHLSGNYSESISYFEEAKRKYDELLTVSVTNQVSTWLINDKRAFYRGEDFERIMINFFQAVNFVMTHQFEEALVEARNADRMLTLINNQYPESQKNKYKEDGAARLIMGILFEATQTPEGQDDAYISYKKALEAYENEFYRNAGFDIPLILKQNILSLSKHLDPDGYKKFKDKFSDIKEEESGKNLAEVYLIFYGGLSPVKHQFSLPIPLPNGFVGKLAFPQYDRREYESAEGYFKAVSDKEEWNIELETIEDIGYLANSTLEDRKSRVIAKAVVRSAGKLIIEDVAENAIHESYGNTAGDIFRYIASLYNIASEEADLRSWQTLPDKIKIARLRLKPGKYRLYYQDHQITDADLKAGDRKFFVYRSTDE